MNFIMLSIVIVNYNVKYFLEQCLYSVYRAARNMKVEVFVVDNASTDGSEEYIRPIFKDVKYITNSENTGFAAANNLAIKQCRGKYVLLLNPDTVVGDNVLEDAYYFMQDHPDAGGAGVMMLDCHGSFLPESKRGFPTPWASFCKLFGLAKAFPKSRLFASYNLSYLSPSERHTVDVLAGAFMFIRREALDKAGLLDEEFFMYGEDIDLSYRLVLAGYRNYYLPLPILHYKGESSRQSDMSYIRNFYGAMLIFFRKYYPGSSRLMTLLIDFAIKIKARQATRRATAKSYGLPAFLKTQSRNVLIICKEENLSVVKKVCYSSIPAIETLEWERAPGKHHFATYTDIVFCYPDMSFEQMLNRMYADSGFEPGELTVHHIYNNVSRQIITATDHA